MHDRDRDVLVVKEGERAVFTFYADYTYDTVPLSDYVESLSKVVGRPWCLLDGVAHFRFNYDSRWKRFSNIDCEELSKELEAEIALRKMIDGG